MKNRLAIITALVLLTSTSTLAQQPAPKREESHKYRTILTVAGGGGAFALGVFVGLNAFDDAVNSDRKPGQRLRFPQRGVLLVATF